MTQKQAENQWKIDRESIARKAGVSEMEVENIMSAMRDRFIENLKLNGTAAMMGLIQVSYNSKADKNSPKRYMAYIYKSLSKSIDHEEEEEDV